jgi:hypothetical protein
MTTFPTLTPSTRTYSPGEFPSTAHPLLSGSEVRVRHSNTVLGVRLRLTFAAASSDDILAVRNHYNGRRGGFLPFAIPVDLLSGVSSPDDFTPAGHQWVYAARPQVVDVPIEGPTPTNRHDLVVELQTVPPENTIVAGARIAARAFLRAGSAQLGTYIGAIARLTAGAASAVTPGLAPGASITATASLVAGEASTGSIDVAAITYTQSSVYSGNAAATNAGMTNGVFAETVQTATNANPNEFVRMDLGAVYPVATIYLGCDFSNTLAGGWGKTYTESRDLEYSTDGASWTFILNTGTLSAGITTYSVSFNARYIRIYNTGSLFLAVTEFYATST